MYQLAMPEDDGNMMRRLAIFLIRAYKWLRPVSKSGRCIYRPTCTEYAIEAISRYGIYHGMILARSRLKRCNEFSESGYDPVPDLISRDQNQNGKDEEHGNV